MVRWVMDMLGCPSCGRQLMITSQLGQNVHVMHRLGLGFKALVGYLLERASLGLKA